MALRGRVRAPRPGGEWGRRSHFIQLLRVGAVWVVAASDKPMIVLSPAFYKEAAAGGAFLGIGQYTGIVYCVVTAGKVRATDKSFSVFTDFKQVSCLASGTFGLPLPTEAALGASIKVPIENGDIVVKLPPETSSGQKLKMANEGLKNPKNGKKGDMILTVKIVIPKNLSEKEKALYKELSAVREFNPRENEVKNG